MLVESRLAGLKNAGAILRHFIVGTTLVPYNQKNHRGTMYMLDSSVAAFQTQLRGRVCEAERVGKEDMSAFDSVT